MNNNPYDEGKRVGATWTKDWVPGGPFIYPGNDRIAVKSREVNAEWTRGFHDGFATRKERTDDEGKR